MENRKGNMPKRILCKFFAHGECLKGEHCDFSHDWKVPPNNICNYYQKGMCSYGSRCRYEHVKLSRLESASSSSRTPHKSVVSNSSRVAHPARTVSSRGARVLRAPADLSVSSSSCFPPIKPSLNLESRNGDLLNNVDLGEPKNFKSADVPICSLAAAGNCHRGDKCPYVHGDLCPTCRKHCLHPFKAEEREKHLTTCEKNQKYLEALKHSQEIECNVCLDRVLSKPTAAERKFGLLSECDHPFCISCIRNWRSSTPTSGMDVNTSLRACPICRKLSYFVVPSVIWYSSKEEKQEIIDNYKARLRSIDCKHFDFGNGNCPFGTSCFYKHTVKPGSYAWKYHRPPPRRLPPRRTNAANMDAVYDMLEQLIGEEDEPNIFGFEDSDEEDMTPFDMAFLLMGLDLGLCDSSSEEDDYPF